MQAASRIGTPPQDYTGPDRRKNLPTIELWQENIKFLNQSGLTNCQMRYALVSGKLSFFVRFENEIPIGKLDILFPEVDEKMLEAEGWSKFVLTITINDEGRLLIELWGHYERDGVPLDVKVDFARDIGLGVGLAMDQVAVTDTRNGEVTTATMKEIIDERLKDGERRYARKDDDVMNVSVEGMVAIGCRYLKQLAVRRRAIK
jgi:hypothetical protein